MTMNDLVWWWNSRFSPIDVDIIRSLRSLSKISQITNSRRRLRGKHAGLHQVDVLFYTVATTQILHTSKSFICVYDVERAQRNPKLPAELTAEL